MIAVEVTYTVDSAFLEQNRKNIANFLADFTQLKHLNFLYNVFLKSDGVTFMHLSTYADEVVQNQILNVPSFLQFQKERDEQGLIGEPKIEIINLIGTSLTIV